MFLQRSRGLFAVHILCQLLLAGFAFWLFLLVFAACYPKPPLEFIERYPIYCGLVLAAILVEALSADTSRKSTVHKTFAQSHGISLRQILFVAIGLMVFLVATKDKAISRAFLFTFMFFLYLVLLASNRLLLPLLAHVFFSGTRSDRTLLAGPARKVGRLKAWLARRSHLGVNTIGLVCYDAPAGSTVEGYTVLGRIDQMASIAEREKVTQLVLVEFPMAPDFLRNLVNFCEKQGIRLLVVSDLEDKFGHSVTYILDDNIRFIGLRDEPLENPLNRALKRFLDWVVSVPLVLLVLPPMALLVWVIHRLQSRGPLLVRQPRAGIQGQVFNIVKFRTMHVNNDEPARQASADDPRVFPAGRWLRRLSLDELPQFLNVLRGDMSVVGPRPHLLEHNERFARVMRNYNVRRFAKPGITGLAQVRGFRGEIRSDEDLALRVACDIDYIENWSLAMDLMILLRTMWTILRPPQTAY